MIKSVGIDLGSIGEHRVRCLDENEHRVRCLDENAQMCDSFGFDTTRVGLAKLEERIFKDGANPVIIFEPTGLAWLLVVVYIKSRYPDSRLVRVQAQKVVALRKYLNRSTPSPWPRCPLSIRRSWRRYTCHRVKSMPYSVFPASEND